MILRNVFFRGDTKFFLVLPSELVLIRHGLMDLQQSINQSLDDDEKIFLD